MSILKQHKQTIIAIIIVLINFLIKGIFLSSNSLGGDEPFSVYHAQMNIVSIINLLSEGNNPPLYEIILHFWIKIFGISEFSVRMPSLIFSCITVLFIYKIGIKYLNNRIALYSSFIFIFSNYHILFAHEARVYALLGLLSVISMYYFIGIMQYCTIDTKIENNLKSMVRKKLLILIIIDILIIYSHYFGFFILVTQFIIFVLNMPLTAKYWRQLVFVVSVIGLLYMPNIFVVLNRFIESSSKGTWVKPVESLGNLFGQIYFYSNYSRFTCFIVISIFLAATWKLFYLQKDNNYIKGFLLIVIIPILFLTSYSIFFQIPFFWRLTSNKIYSIGFPLLVLCVNIIWIVFKKKYEISKSANHGLIVSWFVFIFCFMFVVSFWIPMFIDRYLMTAAVAFPLVVAISADYIIKKHRFKFIIPIAITLLFASTVKADLSNNRDVKETVSKTKELKTSSAIVYFCPDYFDLNFVYYYNIEYFKGYDEKKIKNKIHKNLNSENIFPISSYNQIDTNLIKNMDKIIYLDAAADFCYPENNIKNKLDLNYRLKNEYKFYEIFNVYEYELK